MKILLIISAFFLLRVAGCEKEPVYPVVSGKYTGTFIRITPDARYSPSKVTVTFTGNRFVGAPETINYPAICSGTFNISGSKMMVTNECMFTANFDWTFIFNGDYTFEMNGNKLKITKNYGNNTYDQYILEK